MKRYVVAIGISIGVITFVFSALIAYIFFTNRTIDQTLVTNFPISNEWIEIDAYPLLGEFRMVAELAIAIPSYDHNPRERLPWGQFRLPDGRIATPQIEGVDDSGNLVIFKHSGFTMSRRDLVVFRPEPGLGHDIKLAKIRIRSDEPFTCEEIFWRNRNLK
ncbi:MAG TPA: hypothetical protein PLL77_03625 [Pyrinomonadaceae bacterium]|nr:hypothetical protein [Pyrinomonadaceae bacterium]